MAYAALNSPLPGLTLSPEGCHSCGMRGYKPGLGDDTIDTTSTDNFGDLTDTGSPITETLTYPDTTNLLDTGSVDTNVISPDLSSDNPATVGTEFISVGGGNYLNTQTGQTVPLSVAQAVTAATTGPATENLQTVNTEGNLTLTDPTAGTTTTVALNSLTTAAQALQAAGKLVNAAGQLTAQGQALAASGNLYTAPPATGVSAALSSLGSWFSTGNNGMLVIGLLAAVIVLPSLISGKKRRR